MNNLLKTYGSIAAFGFLLLLLTCQVAISQNVTIQIDASKGRKAVSPYIYGRNNSLGNLAGNSSAAGWQMLRDAGVKMFRECGGNNSTKYNWRLKLSSHPDWYNNVYANDWDKAARSLQQSIPSAQGMWAFQLIGKVASNTNNNFNDWGYNQAKWWQGVNQNLAGGGTPNTSGGNKALKEGDINLYLMDWPADSTTGILKHWFGENGLKLDKNKIQYWGMDNEAEIWSGTHDDVMPKQISAEEFMQKYFSVAKKARALYPGIKLLGPVAANEWQWYNWGDGITVNGKYYPWLEYFIKRIGEEQLASGVRLLDVIDIHYYPTSQTDADIVQYHRIFFDKTYVYPEANGVKKVNGGWDNTITKEYIFERCREWLIKYIGAGHGVTFGVTECGLAIDKPNVTAVWYASTLGEFMSHDVEVFTPWDWKTGMWEVLHLYSRYNKVTSIESVSSLEQTVSAYSTINTALDSLTVMLVNRSLTETKNTTINLSNFSATDGAFNTLTLNNLPGTETFVSHSGNALKTGSVAVSNNSFTLVLPPLSVTCILLSGKANPPSLYNPVKLEITNLSIYPNPASVSTVIAYSLDKPSNVKIEISSERGELVKVILNEYQTQGTWQFNSNTSDLRNGIYFIRLTNNSGIQIKKLIIGK
jgi:hypothetical protein